MVILWPLWLEIQRSVFCHGGLLKRILMVCAVNLSISSTRMVVSLSATKINTCTDIRWMGAQAVFRIGTYSEMDFKSRRTINIHLWMRQIYEALRSAALSPISWAHDVRRQSFNRLDYFEWLLSKSAEPIWFLKSRACQMNEWKTLWFHLKVSLARSMRNHQQLPSCLCVHNHSFNQFE